MRYNPLPVICFLAAGSLTACGGGGSISLEDYTEEHERAECERDVRCGEAPDMESCLAASFDERVNYPKTRANAVEAGTIIYDGDAARKCIDAVAKDDCTFSNWDTLFAACVNVFEGTVPEGGTCVVFAECAGDVSCETDPGCTPESCCVGTCRPPLVEIGGDCSVNYFCVRGAYCHQDFVAGTATCEAELPIGSACDVHVNTRASQIDTSFTFCHPG